MKKKENLERGEREKRKREKKNWREKRKLEEHWKMIRCLVNSIDENQDQWDQDRDWRQVAESGEMHIRNDGEKEIPSEAHLSREIPLPKQELSQDEAQLGKKDDDTNFNEIQSPLNNEMSQLNQEWSTLRMR